jgi:hypothetical protein
MDVKRFFTKNKRALFGGLLVFLFTGTGVFLLGSISGNEAKHLIEASLSGLNMLCNTIVLASATILALLLTLLGISTGSNSRLKGDHYKQVLNIAKFDTTLFISALILFQLFNIPISEADNIPTVWFNWIYWGVLLSSSVISGMMVTVILLLHTTVTNIIAIVGLGHDHSLISKEELEDEKDRKKEEGKEEGKKKAERENN